MALQYADDTAFIAKANSKTLITLKIILRLFVNISGLSVSYDKSSFIPFNLNSGDIWKAKVILLINQTAMPIEYLGMPLSIFGPAKRDFMPLIEKLEKKWKDGRESSYQERDGYNWSNRLFSRY